MPWRVGIDEAGYGPNLGPLVLTAVACRTPEGIAEANLWEVLGRAVHRYKEKAGGRLLVDDSKKVYAAGKKLGRLEKSVLSILHQAGGGTLDGLLERLCHPGWQGHRGEAWYRGDTVVPRANTPEELLAGASHFAETCREHGLAWGTARCLVIEPARFNELVDRWGSKGAVLAVAFSALLQAHLADAEEATQVTVDKHGGRNRYAAILQEAVPKAMVLTREEGPRRSLYEVAGLGFPVRVSFHPRADGQDLCVALASMVSKYVRELLMEEFNRYWRERLPGLAPTAGYPVDARRFFAAIEPLLGPLGLDKRAVWRQQ